MFLSRKLSFIYSGVKLLQVQHFISQCKGYPSNLIQSFYIVWCLQVKVDQQTTSSLNVPMLCWNSISQFQNWGKQKDSLMEITARNLRRSPTAEPKISVFQQVILDSSYVWRKAGYSDRQFYSYSWQHTGSSRDALVDRSIL